MPKRTKKTYMQRVRPLCLSLLTAGGAAAAIMFGRGDFWLGTLTVLGGAVGALVAAISAKALDFIEAFEYKPQPHSEKTLSSTLHLIDKKVDTDAKQPINSSKSEERV